ncbi:MAG: STAS domain-containing protein [Ignavibacteria bacterium]|nr:STAS domain-containing protein [Ignavibacteria bacterium]
MKLEKEKVTYNELEYLVIKLSPELLGLHNKDILKENIESDLKSNNKNFIIDFSKIETINSSGIGILISILNMIKEYNGTLKISNYNEKVRKIFELTKLNLVFDLI